MENNNKAKWINTILSELNKTNNSKTEKLVEACGRACLESSGTLEKIDGIRKLVSDKKDLGLLFKLYKEQVYDNSERLTKKGNTIYLLYDKCGCGMVKDGEVSNPFLCNCTIGYTKAIFERLFDKPVQVNLLKSILRGNDICFQEILI